VDGTVHQAVTDFAALDDAIARVAES
jgi:hypothetical protein